MKKFLIYVGVIGFCLFAILLIGKIEGEKYMFKCKNHGHIVNINDVKSYTEKHGCESWKNMASSEE